MSNSRTLSHANWKLQSDSPFALLSVDSPVVNSIRWYRTKKLLPFIVLRRYSNVRDVYLNNAVDECPIYRLDGSKVTDAIEYDVVQCVRALFKDIEKIFIEHNDNARFGIFLDMNCKRSERVDVIDGGLFAVSQVGDDYSTCVMVECNVLVR